MSRDPIKLRIETIDNYPVFLGFRDYTIIPQRLDIIFYKGINYKIIYRKFVYNIGNDDIKEIILKVEEIKKEIKI